MIEEPTEIKISNRATAAAAFFLFDPDHLINKNAFNNNCQDEKN